ncbi:sorting nexin-3-like [Neocloeon triangulifer]|uniref:sorting nexin-3-like n=1 Tax=Neocloeon triangulifer TaxID=2078957 RepID=UPI00286F4598|nr:sorting nexin-3-like [Neocloeon triangulifer]
MNIDISVQEPMLVRSSPVSGFTTFTIYLHTSHPAFSVPKSSCRRKFSEFQWLRRLLLRHHPHRNPPDLPSSAFLLISLDEKFLEQRRLGLQTFLRELVCVPSYLGEKAVHMFLQTELNINRIQENVDGLRDDLVAKHSQYWPKISESQDVSLAMEPTQPRQIQRPRSNRVSSSSTGESFPGSPAAMWSSPHSYGSALIC